MNKELYKLLFKILFVTYFSSGFSLIGKRRCLNRLLSQVNVSNFETSTYAVYNRNSSNVELYANVSWNLSVPQGLELDGIAFRLRNLNPLHAYRDPPINVCNLGSDYLWFKTANTSCEAGTNHCEFLTDQSNQNFRICPYDFYPTGQCTSIGELFIKHLGYQSIPPHVRELTFKIDFHYTYSLFLLPYYKKFIHPSNIYHEIHPAIDCPNKVSDSLGITTKESESLCCDQNIPHFIARNFNFGKPQFHYGNNIVNMTMSWLPPITSAGFIRFRLFIYSDSFNVSLFPFKTSIEKLLLTNEMVANLSRCDNTSDLYKVVFYNLQPNTSYEVIIRSVFSDDQEFVNGCQEGNCELQFSLRVPGVNACDNEYTICDEVASCVPDDPTGRSSTNVTCACPGGYFGNGVNPSKDELGTGCTDTDYCTQDLNLCDLHATCIDRAAPMKGADCQCRDGYYGNGITCSLVSVVVISVIIPLMLLLTFLVLVIARKYPRLIEKRFRTLFGSKSTRESSTDSSPEKLSSLEKYIPFA